MNLHLIREYLRKYRALLVSLIELDRMETPSELMRSWPGGGTASVSCRKHSMIASTRAIVKYLESLTASEAGHLAQEHSCDISALEQAKRKLGICS